MKRTLAVRVELLENTVSGLSDLPRQFTELSSQFAQLGADVRGEISAIRDELTVTRDGVDGKVSTMGRELRGEMSTMREELRGEMSTMREELRGEMSGMREELRGDMSDMHRDLAKAILSSEDRVVSQMRMLHEDVIERMALIQPPQKPRAVQRGGQKPPRRQR